MDIQVIKFVIVSYGFFWRLEICTRFEWQAKRLRFAGRVVEVIDGGMPGALPAKWSLLRTARRRSRCCGGMVVARLALPAIGRRRGGDASRLATAAQGGDQGGPSPAVVDLCWKEFAARVLRDARAMAYATTR